MPYYKRFYAPIRRQIPISYSDAMPIYHCIRTVSKLFLAPREAIIDEIEKYCNQMKIRKTNLCDKAFIKWSDNQTITEIDALLHDTFMHVR